MVSSDDSSSAPTDANLASTSHPTPPTSVLLVSRDEVSITLEIENKRPLPTKWQYRIEYRLPGQEWPAATDDGDNSSTRDSVYIAPEGAHNVTLEDLLPTSTYEIRVFTIDLDSKVTSESASDVVAVDTDVPGCTSGPSCQCVLL